MRQREHLAEATAARWGTFAGEAIRVVAEIVATGATAAEVLEAFTCHSAGDQTGTQLQRSQRGAVGGVYEILMRDDPDPREGR